MEISRPNEATVLIAAIDPIVAEFLRLIVPSADPGDSETARARLFSGPSHDRKESGFSRDWKEYVEPELAKLFQSALDVISGDLKRMHPDPMTGNATLVIPADHLESWLHGLNQACVVLSERYQLREDELLRGPWLAGDPRALLLHQLDLYYHLQELFLRYLEGH